MADTSGRGNFEDTSNKIGPPPKKKLKKNKDTKNVLHTKFKGKKISCYSFVQERSLGYDNIKFHNIFSTESSAVKKNLITKTLYSSISKVATGNGEHINGVHGAIFNLEFSPDSRYLLAACERNDILIYDPLSFKKVLVVPNAHRESVNCITFQDTRLFATCSDDKNIAIWDIRNLKSKVFLLTGHTNWVKSLTFDPVSHNLISSAFDDTVRYWDLKKSYTSGIKNEIVMNVPSLTRTKLSNINNKGEQTLFIATTEGKLIAVNNLNFDSLKNDTMDLPLNITNNPDRLSQTENKRAVNKIESIDSFPEDSNPWCIASVQLHPTRDMVLSRYTHMNFNSEWSVVHSLKHNPDNNPSYQLQAFIEEPNSAIGYIKELCYSGDGDMICSPFGNSVRLLTLKDNDNAHSNGVNKLNEIKMITGHKLPVLTTRFSPEFPLLVSGCRGGKVVFHQSRF